MNKTHLMILSVVCLCLPTLIHAQQKVDNVDGVSRVKFLNYPDCIELSNKTTREFTNPILQPFASSDECVGCENLLEPSVCLSHESHKSRLMIRLT